ncbi:hypothetical protein [Cryobacterium zhongshanensis]|uniref:Uncharacterized protein n=1 Tax=Cryobacterium zhongshanensis TaxID=2928153 RepID=A0AA41UHI6_9MICO|nr:hypothetical protein [Cryobacterium zhongshanensis]MCI4658479.1 hypothetical protein [Cryobacterium zhongshanensis]
MQYITETVVPLVEKLMGLSQNDDSDNSQVIEAIKPLLSIETVNVLQLLGFNFRKAIGEPLTELVERAILSKAPGDTSVVIQRLQLEREVGYIAVAQDPAAHARLVAMFGN